MVSAILLYNSLQRNMDKSLKTIAKQPEIARETEYYRKAAVKITNIDEFFANDRVYRYAMKAFGLEEMTFGKGMMRKILTDPKTLQRMTDPRYQAFHDAFDFAKYGEKTMLRKVAYTGTMDKYARMTMEDQIGEQNVATRLALYFDRRIKELKGEERFTDTAWAYLLLADKALAQVVQTTLHLPATAAVDAQAKALQAKLSKEQLDDPDLRAKFIQRFMAVYDAENEGANSPALTLVSSVASSAGGLGLSASSLLALQQRRS